MMRVINDEDRAWAALLPADRPVTTQQALDLGLNSRRLRRLVEVGLVRRPFKGVYLSSALADTTETRFLVLRMVVPDGCVVVDRTAGWVWVGERALAPNAHLDTPPLSVFCKPGHRLRSKLTDSGERRLLPRDLTVVDDVTVTTPLRTACDLGRLLNRDQALAALDSLASLRVFTLDELIAEAERFKGYRGVVQLRAWVLITDPDSQSQGESILRLRWYDAGLPRPVCQVEVETPWGTSYWLDIGQRELLLAAEYDGEEFHGPGQQDHDTGRRAWMSEERGWIIVVARGHNIHGRDQDIDARLRQAWRQAEERASRLTRR